MAEVQSIGEINKVKDLTTEEKLEKKRAYHREYMKMRRTLMRSSLTKKEKETTLIKNICIKTI